MFGLQDALSPALGVLEAASVATVPMALPTDAHIPATHHRSDAPAAHASPSSPDAASPMAVDAEGNADGAPPPDPGPEEAVIRAAAASFETLVNGAAWGRGADPLGPASHARGRILWQQRAFTWAAGTLSEKASEVRYVNTKQQPLFHSVLEWLGILTGG
jgi:hypothetical protein